MNYQLVLICFIGTAITLGLALNTDGEILRKLMSFEEEQARSQQSNQPKLTLTKRTFTMSPSYNSKQYSEEDFLAVYVCVAKADISTQLKGI